LDEVVQGAVDSNTPVSVLLRRCLVLAAQLGNEKLKSWANQELNGYANANEVPEYRSIYTHARGNFSGPFGSELTNWPIPPAALQKEHQHWAETAKLVQPIAAFDDLLNTDAKNDGEGTFSIPWPDNLTLFYQRKIIQQQALVSAWQVVSRGVVASLVDTIRNRVLNMALEIQSELKGSDDLGTLKKSDVERTVINNIYGGQNVFGGHGSSITNVVDQSQTTVLLAGNRSKLDEILSQAGLDTSDLKALTAALEADDKKPEGPRVSKWIKTAAPKLAIAGVKYGAEVAKPLLTQWLKQYLGMPPV
jgi:hypothetical protein